MNESPFSPKRSQVMPSPIAPDENDGLSRMTTNRPLIKHESDRNKSLEIVEEAKFYRKKTKEMDDYLKILPKREKYVLPRLNESISVDSR